jgi:hypothetical protein
MLALTFYKDPIFLTDLIRVITISDLQFALFSDMSLEHKISLHGRIYVSSDITTFRNVIKLRYIRIKIKRTGPLLTLPYEIKSFFITIT